jgi:predicted outer membrane repeat protein
MKQLCMTTIIWLLPTLSCFGAVIHVPGDQPTIQAGIDAATTGDTVLVANGTYTGEGNRDISFNGKSILVQSESGWETCVIDCGGSALENHRGFTFQTMETSAAVLTGFTIQNGYYDTSGGGLLCDQSACPLITQCMIRNNTAGSGGGIMCTNNASPTFRECIFEHNTALTSGGGMVLAYSDSLIDACVFAYNTGMNCGGVLISYHSTPLFTQCTFTGNTTEGEGGALTISYNTQPQIFNCKFQENIAERMGGAIYFAYRVEPVVGGSEEHGCEFSGNFAASGSDLAASTYSSEYPINVTWNQLSGDPFSDYYVAPLRAFDLSNCTSLKAPITQDVYVLPTGDDTNDGLTWDQAFRTVRHALSVMESNETDPHTIWLGAGVYSPSTTGETYPLPIVDHITLAGIGREDTILDAEASGRVLYGYRETNAEVRDLTIQGGRCNRGGALYTQFTGMSFTRCTFTGNYADESGGAAYLAASYPTFTDCLITLNAAAENGGGIYSGDATSVFIRCKFSQNTAENGSGGGYHNNMFGHYTFDSCLITGNSAFDSGGGMSLGSKCVSGVITGTEISDNTAGNYGGGFFGGWDVHMTITNSVITGNLTSNQGGAFCLLQECSFEMANLSISNNTALEGGAIYCSDDINLTITDSILWGNIPDGITGDLDEVTAEYCDIQDGFPGMGNISMDPGFIEGPMGECYLSQMAAGQPSDSPCLNAGSASSETVCFETTGGILCMNQRTTRIDGIPDTGLVDMGYHYPEPCEPTPTITPEPTPTTTATQVPTSTPTPPSPTETPPPPTSTPEPPTQTPRPPTDTPLPPTDVPSYTPNPTETPDCSVLGCEIFMPLKYFTPGDDCFCDVLLCNPHHETYSDVPVFAVLDIYGNYFFAPSFGEFDYYSCLIPNGKILVNVLPRFTWPSGAGSASNVLWYAAMTNPAMTELFGELDTFTFGWGM